MLMNISFGWCLFLSTDDFSLGIHWAFIDLQMRAVARALHAAEMYVNVEEKSQVNL